MATQDTSAYATLLKTVYEPGVRDYINTSAPIFMRIQRMTDKKKFVNNAWTFAAKIRNPQGGGAIAEGGTIPTPQGTAPINMVVRMKYHYFALRQTAQLKELSRSQEGAFMDSVALDVNGARDQMKENLHSDIVYGDGTGEIGQVAASGGYSGTTLTMVPLTTNGGIGNSLLFEEMYLTSYSAKSGGSLGANHKQVTAITTPQGATATVEASANFQNSDYLFRSIGSSVDPRSLTFMGLGGIVDDATLVTTIQNLSRSTYPILNARSLRNSGTLRAWTPELMDQIGSTTGQIGGGKAPTAFYTRLPIVQRMASYLRQDRRYVAPSFMTMDGGFKALEWTISGGGAVPVIEDRFMRPHCIMAVHEPDLVLAMQKEPEFVDDDGRTERFTDRTHATEMWLTCWGNLAARQFNNHAILGDISNSL